MTSYVFPDVNKSVLKPVGEDLVAGNIVVPPTTSYASAGLVNEAVEYVVKDQGHTADVAEVLRGLMVRDVRSSVASSYFLDKAAETRSRMVGVSKREIRVSFTLSDEEVQALSDYAPEFRLVFSDEMEHDHGMAAQCRIIDHKIIDGRLPYNVKRTDIGGDPIRYIAEGDRNVHICGGKCDVKDNSRHVVRKMHARRLKKVGGAAVAEMSDKFLNDDPDLVCWSQAQDCIHQSSCLKAVHVYDIPMNMWPRIMDNKNASLVEGCVLFSNRFFDKTAGDLSVVKGRYEIDVDKDIIRMGFQGSPAWWYQHSWTDFMAYGVDQITYSATHCYSYKVIERRGDTLFYRILRMRNVIDPPLVQHYKLPDVPMVQVDGFKIDPNMSISSYRRLQKVRSSYPEPLWLEMFTRASEDYERGELDFSKLANHYRTVSTRQTINSVCVMGGHKVRPEELVQLVVDVGMAAATAVAFEQRTTRGMTDKVLMRRAMNEEYTVWKVLAAFCDTVTLILGGVVLYPLRLLGNLLRRSHAAILEKFLVEWAPDVQVKSMNVKYMIQKERMVDLPVFKIDQLMQQAARDNAPLDHLTAISKNDELKKMLLDIDSGASQEVSEVASTFDESVTAPPSYKTDDIKQQVMPVAVEDIHQSRVAAIREYIHESKMEVAAVDDMCQRAYRMICSGGNPNKAKLIQYAETFHNPDLWEVRNGVIQDSILGVSADDFKHSGCFSMVPDEATGSFVRAVYERNWEGYRGTSKVSNVNWVINDTEFNGYVMTTDKLLIYNGPEIMAALEGALVLRHDYAVHYEFGPAGCGKTYSIIHSAKSDGADVIMCPVRESIEATRRELSEVLPGFPDPKLRVRTVDSYLVNRTLQKKTGALTAERLLGDECMMTHSAKWYACAAYLGVKQLIGYGDDKQIPHVPRVQAPKFFVRLQSQTRHDSWLVYRFGPKIMAAVGDLYDWKARVVNGDRNTVLERVRSVKGRTVPVGCVLMVGYQAWKKDLRRLYGSQIQTLKLKIVSIHESEGKTYDHVWLHNFDTMNRTDNFSLYDKPEYANVALTRARYSMLYCHDVGFDDEISRRIKQGNNVRRIAAARDINSAGTSIEFL